MAHPSMQLLKPYIYHSVNQSLKLMDERALQSSDRHVQHVAITYFHLNMAKQTTLL